MSKIKLSPDDPAYAEVIDKIISANSEDLSIDEYHSPDEDLGNVLKFNTTPVLRRQVENVDLLTIAPTGIFGVIDNTKFYRVGMPLVIITETAGFAGIVNPLISIGNDAGYINMCPPTEISTPAVDFIYDIPLATPGQVIDVSSDPLSIYVQTAADGFTTLKATVVVFGFFITEIDPP